MDKHIREADYVVMVCTETYHRRVTRKEEPGKGLGVAWESSQIYQYIYEAGTNNTRFIPILFEGGDDQHIPTALRSATHYSVGSEQGYKVLYRRLTDQPATVRPKLGKLKKLPPRERAPDYFTGPKVSLAKLPSTGKDLFGREKELALLDKAWDDEQTNVVAFVAWGGVGKSALVNVWLGQMGDKHFRGAQRVYGYSFYSQGAREGAQVSADEFIAEALKWFGDEDPTVGSPWDKGERLADLIKEQRTLLILDGVEPLQNPPGEEAGKIKDPGLCCLLKELANANPGLCVVSTRMEVDDLKGFASPAVEHYDLEHLSDDAGAQLLKSLGVLGTDEELKTAAHDFDSHALALTLLGTYLKVVHKGEIRKRDLIPKLTADPKHGGHAKRVMESYEKWLKGKPELDILRIMGLFDRPAEGGAIEAVKAKPAIKGLTSKLQKLSDADWKFALHHLRQVKLLAPEDDYRPGGLDCHPLVREHFGEKLKEDNPNAWQEAHGRLFEYYKSVPEKDLPDSIEEMAPLFAAVAHGCHAGNYREAFEDVYLDRIERGRESFSTTKLGAVGATLAVLSSLFDPPWGSPVIQLRGNAESWVLNAVGFRLMALGRLVDAVQPLKTGLDFDLDIKDWSNAAISASNLSDLTLTLGNLEQCLEYAQQAVELADRSGDSFQRMSKRQGLANVLHQKGRIPETEAAFSEAEKMQVNNQPEFPFLYSLQGYQYCDLLLSQGKSREVLRRATLTLKWAEREGFLLDIALDHLSLGRAYLLQAKQGKAGNFTQATVHLNQALEGLRNAGSQNNLPLGLLARAELYRVTKVFDKAQKDLTETMTIATRGGMRLHEADCHLEQARLHIAMGNKDESRESYEIARDMVNEMGYHRRDKEVADLDQQLT